MSKLTEKEKEFLKKTIINNLDEMLNDVHYSTAYCDKGMQLANIDIVFVANKFIVVMVAIGNGDSSIIKTERGGTWVSK